MRSKFIDVDGAQTRYLFEGSGYPLLLLHGAGLPADSWLYNIDPLSDEFYVVAPDLLGQGFTDRGGYKGGPPQPSTIAHIQRFVDILGIYKFAVAGSSYGALIASLLYLEMPERVEKLILISSGGCFNSEEGLARSLNDAYQNGLSAISDPSMETCRKRMGRVYYDPAKVPDGLLLAQLTSYSLPSAVESYEMMMKGLMDIEGSRPYRILERLETIKAPTLAIFGKQDPRIADLEAATQAVNRFPQGRMVMFDEAGHVPHMEHPEKFNQLVREFVKG